jgi:hypothetical protein
MSKGKPEIFKALFIGILMPIMIFIFGAIPLGLLIEGLSKLGLM